jgi:hypothetical protein
MSTYSSSLEFFDDDLVYVCLTDPGLSLGCANNAKSQLEMKGQGCRVVGPHIREQFLVSLAPGGLEGDLGQTCADAFSSVREGHKCSDDADVIKGVRVRSEWLYALQAKDGVVLPSFGYVKHTAIGEVYDVLAFELYAQRGVERGVRAAFDDGVEDADNRFRVLWPDLTNEQIHLFSSCQWTRKNLIQEFIPETAHSQNFYKPCS